MDPYSFIALSTVLAIIIGILLSVWVAAIRKRRKAKIAAKQPAPKPWPGATTQRASSTRPNISNRPQRGTNQHVRNRGMDINDGPYALDVILAAEIINTITDDEPAPAYAGGGGTFGGGGASESYQALDPEPTKSSFGSSSSDCGSCDCGGGCD